MSDQPHLVARWHIEGEITHDWKKLAERKAKQLRKLSDTYKGQLDKVSIIEHFHFVSYMQHACLLGLHSCFCYRHYSSVSSAMLMISIKHAVQI